MCACDDEAAEQAMRQAVDAARADGESLGGVFEVWAWGLVPGVGGYETWSNRLDGRLLGAVGSIPAVKGVEIGLGMAAAALPRLGGARSRSCVTRPWPRGSETPVLGRASNRAGGLEGGVTNGMPVIVRGAMKPIPTLLRPLPSVDLETLLPVEAHVERSDVEAVAAARVVAEAMVAITLADAYRQKFGGDSLEDACGALGCLRRPSGGSAPVAPVVALTGFMASGKSVVGRAVAERLGWRFADLDGEIERAQRADRGGVVRRRGGERLPSGRDADARRGAAGGGEAGGCRPRARAGRGSGDRPRLGGPRA